MIVRLCDPVSQMLTRTRAHAHSWLLMEQVRAEITTSLFFTASTSSQLVFKKKKKSGAGGGKQTTCNYPIQPMHHFLPCWRSKRASVSVATLLPGDSCGFGWVDVSELTERDRGEPRMALVKCSTQCVVVVQMLQNTCGFYWFTSVFIQCHHVYVHVYMYFYFRSIMTYRCVHPFIIFTQL